MIAARPLGEIPQPAPVPRLLVELPSWPRVFFENLRDLVSPPPASAARTSLRAGAVLARCVREARRFRGADFCNRCLSRRRVRAADRIHSLLRTAAAGRGEASLRPLAGDLLPAVGISSATRYSQRAARRSPKKADPEFSRQPIISVPPEADNRRRPSSRRPTSN